MHKIKYDDRTFNLKSHWLEEDGKIYTQKNKEEMCEVCSQEVYIEEIYENIESGDEYVKIAFRDIGQKTWKSVITDKLNIMHNGKIVNLSRKGLDVNTGNSTRMVKYFADIINNNKKTINRKLSTSKIGWYKDSFIPYDSDLVYDGEDCFKSAYESIKCVGDYGRWLKEMSYVRQNLAARLMMAGSFGSVLLRILGKKPLVLMLWGTTGDGKTVAGMTAMSIWGSPEEGNLQFSMNNTDNFYFRTANFFNNIPCFFDELQTYPYPNKLDKLIMAITEGIDRGKARADGGIEKPKKWQNIFLMTGEQSASNYNSGGGTLNRLIEISTSGKIIEYGSQTARVVKHNYGWAGKEFVEYIKKVGDEYINDKYTEILNELLEESDTEDKQAQNMAILLLADEIARECIFKEEKEINIKDVLEFMFTKKEIDISERAWEFVQNEFLMNIDNFYPGGREKWGKIGFNGFQVTVNKNKLEKILMDNQFNPKKMYKDWSNSGKLEKSSDGRYSQNTSVNGVKGHFIVLNMNIGERKEY